ncbi:MAG: hypothetical protein ABEL76_01720, partial [Bradymonadaceae bacterium]
EPGDTFFMTNQGARFCLSCDCIVIDEDSVFEMLSHGRPDWDIGDDIAVAGIVDWEAAPDDQRDRPLMEIEPSPIVFFDGFGFEDELDDSGRRRRRPDRGSSGNDVSDRLRRKRREKWSGSDED